MREQKWKQNRCCVAAPRHIVANECPSFGERQEHLDAIVSFAGAGQKGRLFRCLDILTIKWATGDLLLDARLMFLKTEKDPTSKQFDDDEWIRSLTEAQQVSTDVPEDSVTYDQQDVDPEKVRPIQMGEFLRKYVFRRETSMREIGVGTQGGVEALAIFHQLLYDIETCPMWNRKGSRRCRRSRCTARRH